MKQLGISDQRSQLMSYLLVVRPKHNPATEGVAHVDHAGAAAETQDFREGHLHG